MSFASRIHAKFSSGVSVVNWNGYDSKEWRTAASKKNFVRLFLVLF